MLNSMSQSKIRDNPSIKEVTDQVEELTAFRKAWPMFRPILKLFGAEVSSVEDMLDNVSDMKEQANELASIPDRFNEIFASRGWIIYSAMNLDVAQKAIGKAEEGLISEAEDMLLSYYDSEKVESELNRMRAVKAFTPRMRLANLALEDFKAKRYHACIPVVLALLDGMVNELSQNQRGFFSEEADMQAWDSFAAHSSGLNALAAIFRRGRQKTQTEPITIPYRNGILHGTDLAYDNAIVAAKCWAALFAAREWALKVEHGNTEPTPSARLPTFRENIRQIRELDRRRKLVDAWQPRKLQVGVDIPSTGDPTDYENKSPEKLVMRFLHLWKARNYGFMARLLSRKYGPEPKGAAARAREAYGEKTLEHFELIAVDDRAAGAANIQVQVRYDEHGRQIEKTGGFQLFCVDSSGEWAIQGLPDSSWEIVLWDVF